MVAFLRATLGFEPEIMREGWSEVVPSELSGTIADVFRASSCRQTS